MTQPDGLLARYARGSLAVGAARRARTVAGGGVQRLADPVGRAYPHSWLGAVANGLESAADHSRIIGWLTKEPEPAVVTIDLAETRTVGPFLSAIEWLAARLQRPYRSSRSRTLGAGLSDLSAEHWVRAASGVLLGIVIGTVALGAAPLTPSSLLFLATVTVAAFLGLVLDQPGVVLQESRVASGIARALAPPAPHDGGE